MESENKFLVDLSVAILKNRFAIDEPTNNQVEDMKAILETTWLRRAINFDERLTAREKACLYLASLGKDAKASGEFLGISAETVRVHRRETLRKLKCKNIAQAVSVGVRYGEIAASDLKTA
jgi:DNA-binding CsgD family transcriptional regulator